MPVMILECFPCYSAQTPFGEGNKLAKQLLVSVCILNYLYSVPHPRSKFIITLSRWLFSSGTLHSNVHKLCWPEAGLIHDLLSSE